MTDASNIQEPAAGPEPDPAPPPVTEPGAPEGGLQGFVGSPIGRVTLIGAGIAVVAGLVLVVALVVVNAFSTPPATTVTGTTPAGAVGATSAVTSSAAESTAAAALPISNEPSAPPPPLGNVSDDDVFVPRDPFSKPRVPMTMPEGKNVKLSGDEQALVVLDVVSKDGKLHAVLLVNGVKYTVSDGERVDSTPWQVITVFPDGLTIMYGDQIIAIQVGQGIAP